MRRRPERGDPRVAWGAALSVSVAQLPGQLCRRGVLDGPGSLSKRGPLFSPVSESDPLSPAEVLDACLDL